MGRLQDLRVVDPVLTELSYGYVNDMFVADALFPFVPVQKEEGKIVKFGKEAFRIWDTGRAIRAKSNRIPPEGRTPVSYALSEHDLEYPIDYREEEEDIFPLEEYATEVTNEGIRLGHEKQAADIAQDADNYGADNKITLTGTDQWSDLDDSDPIGDVRQGKSAVRAAIGRYPNTMLIGVSAYEILQDHPQILERVKYSQTGIVSVDLLKVIFDIEDIRVGKAVYSPDGIVFSDVWLDNVVLAYVPKQALRARTVREPSYGYTLRKEGRPETDTYSENGGKIEVVRTTDIYEPLLLGPDGGYLIKDVKA